MILYAHTLVAALLCRMRIGCDVGLPRPSPLPGEALAGVLCVPLSRCGSRFPLRFDKGELIALPDDGAAGFRAQAGAIFALNAAGERRALTPPFSRAWRPAAEALKPDAGGKNISRLRALSESLSALAILARASSRNAPRPH